MSDQAIDHAILKTRLDGHEAICTQRYGEISTSFGRVHDRLDWIMRGIIAVLISAAAFLISQLPIFN